jgi:hypothetical protein
MFPTDLSKSAHRIGSTLKLSRSGGNWGKNQFSSLIGACGDWILTQPLSFATLCRYYPSVFILKAGQFVHINKGRLHAFRKMTTENLPQWDSHAKLRKEVVAKDKLQPGLVCISIAHDW